MAGHIPEQQCVLGALHGPTSATRWVGTQETQAATTVSPTTDQGGRISPDLTPMAQQGDGVSIQDAQAQTKEGAQHQPAQHSSTPRLLSASPTAPITQHGITQIGEASQTLLCHSDDGRDDPRVGEGLSPAPNTPCRAATAGSSTSQPHRYFGMTKDCRGSGRPRQCRDGSLGALLACPARRAALLHLQRLPTLEFSFAPVIKTNHFNTAAAEGGAGRGWQRRRDGKQDPPSTRCLHSGLQNGGSAGNPGPAPPSSGAEPFHTHPMSSPSLGQPRAPL